MTGNDETIYIRGDALPETLAVSQLARWMFHLRMPWCSAGYFGDAASAVAMKRREWAKARRGVTIVQAVSSQIL